MQRQKKKYQHAGNAESELNTHARAELIRPS